MNYTEALTHMMAGGRVRHESMGPGEYVRVEGDRMLHGCRNPTGSPGDVEIPYRGGPRLQLVGEWSPVPDPAPTL